MLMVTYLGVGCQEAAPGNQILNGSIYFGGTEWISPGFSNRWHKPCQLYIEFKDDSIIMDALVLPRNEDLYVQGIAKYRLNDDFIYFGDDRYPSLVVIDRTDDSLIMKFNSSRSSVFRMPSQIGANSKRIVGVAKLVIGQKVVVQAPNTLSDNKIVTFYEDTLTMDGELDRVTYYWSTKEVGNSTFLVSDLPGLKLVWIRSVTVTGASGIGFGQNEDIEVTLIMRPN